MERAEARRLQPHYIESFFLEAFERLGGSTRAAEPRRYEVTHVPAACPQSRPAHRRGRAGPAAVRADRVREVPDRVRKGSRSPRSSVPGHPLLDSTIDLTLERHRDLLRRGAVLVDDRDPGRVAARRSSTWSTQSRTPCVARARARCRKRPAMRRLETHAVRRDGRRREHAAPPLRAVPGLPAARHGRAGSSTRFWRAPSAAWLTRDLESSRPGARRRHGCSRTHRRSENADDGATRQDRGRREGPAHQGDQLLGPPIRGTASPGAGGAAEREAELRRSAQACGRVAGASREAARGPAIRASAVAAPAGRARRDARRPSGPAGRDGWPNRTRYEPRHAGVSRARPCRRDGRRTPPGFRANRPRVREAWATTSRAACPAPVACGSSR